MAPAITAKRYLVNPDEGYDVRIEGPYADDKSMFMFALGALLASTMRSEFDDDDCERGL